MSLNSLAQINMSLEATVSSIEDQLSKEEGVLARYGNEIPSRMCQKIGLEIDGDFARCFQADKPGQTMYFPSSGLIIGKKDHCLGIRNKNLLVNVLKFFALWSMGVLKAFSPSRYNHDAVHLVYGVPAEAYRGKRAQLFQDYCKGQYIDLHGESDALIVQDTHRTDCHAGDRVFFARHPLLEALVHRPLRFRQRLKLLRLYMSSLFSFFGLMRVNHAFSLLWQDFAFQGAATFLNDERVLKKAVITNSSWKQQFLWMRHKNKRHFTVDLALYSLNTFIPRDDPDIPVQLHPSMKRVAVDRVLVWCDSYRQLLRKAGVDVEVVVTDPMLWEPMTKRSESLSDKSFRIGVFDVNPRLKSWEKTTGTENTYYSLDNLLSFIDGVVMLADAVEERLGVPVQLILKHKRESHWSYDPCYDNRINEWLESDSRVLLAESDDSLPALVACCALVFVIPFSSPASVAANLGVESLYFDPTGNLVPLYPTDKNIRFLSGFEQLKAHIDVLTSCEKQEAGS